MFSSILVSLKKEVYQHIGLYSLLFIVLVGSLFVRVYRTEDLLRFHFDQGRDALVIWKLWHEGKPFLIGPVTGLAGIFLGPFFYYLIAPLYLVGGGSPVFPAVFIASLTVLALIVTYYLGYKMHSRSAGLIATTIAGFSYYMVLAGRWLSNPTPILLTSVLLLWSMWEIIRDGSKLWWIVAAFLIGISLQLEAASAVFYIPMFAVFSAWMLIKDNKNFPSVRILLVAFLFFFATLIPQLLFNFRHDNLLVNNFRRILLEEKSFRPPLGQIVSDRLDYFWGVFTSKLYPGWRVYASLFTILSTVVLLTAKFTFKRKVFTLFIIFLGVPMLGYIFFQGNYGNIYDYYMTGYFLPMILLFSIGMGELWKKPAGKAAVVFFFVTFFMLSGELTKNYLRAGVDGPTHISLGNQLQAVDWMFDNRKGVGEFNSDVYVPPVIPYAYDYLFLWQGTKRCGEDLCGMVNDKQLETVYVLYEEDPPHPERLTNWLSRYEDNTIIEDEARFGGITVQRRKRI